MLHGKLQLRDWRPWTIRIWDRFSRLTGWRNGAFINTILVSIVFLVLISSHIFLWVRSGSLTGYQIIYSGSCVENGVDRLNTLLHLVINILSTLVFASTNFFMQILNAPNREELNAAHEKRSWLDIGVPSPRNALRVSRFKTTMWLLFFLSSIPMHLLFNSSVFSADDRGSEFSYFVFDESVMTGSAVFEPGTSLSVPVLKNVDWDVVSDYDQSTRTWGNITAMEIAREFYFETGYSERSRIINTTVEEIRAGNWYKLNKSSCESLYKTSSCSGLRAYRNVAIVVHGSSGWNRSQVWNVPPHESSFWDTYVPQMVNNSLWFASASNISKFPCRMRRVFQTPTGTEQQTNCASSCSDAMGFGTGDSDRWQYPLFPGRNIYQTTMTSVRPAPEFENSRLSVEYCLAEPFETVCHIGLASTLLWLVSICVLLKTILCFVVVTKLGKETSLVTPGDVIESFISHPPNYALGPCLLEQHSLRSYGEGDRHSLLAGPIQWISKKRRRWHAIPKRIWLSSYSILSIGIALLVYFFVTSHPVNGWQGSSSFGQDVDNDTIDFPGSWSPTFEQAILIANSPQLFLSFAYLAFNNLFTRLHMAKEWSDLSTRYKALRVTSPQGQQNSTYFLQLPYRYSVPILIISTLLHWVLSGCIYLLVIKGTYLSDFGSNGPFNSIMAIGFSKKSLFTMMVLSITLAFMPPIFGSFSMPSNTVVVGSNSLAIAAACQVSPLVGQKLSRPEAPQQESTSDPQGNEIELQHLMAPSPCPSAPDDQASETHQDDDEQKAILIRVSQSKIRWGVVKMPSSWEEQFDRRDISVEHVSFGLPEDDVQQPITGHWYA